MLYHPLAIKVAHRCLRAIRVASKAQPKIRTASNSIRRTLEDRMLYDVYQLGRVVATIKTAAIFPRTLILPEDYKL
jgi:hypothetical protein